MALLLITAEDKRQGRPFGWRFGAPTAAAQPLEQPLGFRLAFWFGGDGWQGCGRAIGRRGFHPRQNHIATGGGGGGESGRRRTCLGWRPIGFERQGGLGRWGGFGAGEQLAYFGPANARRQGPRSEADHEQNEQRSALPRRADEALGQQIAHQPPASTGGHNRIKTVQVVIGQVGDLGGKGEENGR